METLINYCSPSLLEPISRRCRVTDLWGKIFLDWNSNPALAGDRLQSTQVSEDSKFVVRPCSVRVERYSLSSSALVWGVEKVKLKDQTVQLVYHGVRVRDGDSEGEVANLEDETSEMNNEQIKDEPIEKINEKQIKDEPIEMQTEEQINVMHSETNLKCPKCGKGFNNTRSLYAHVLTHYYQLFFKVLSNRKPYPCPICGKVNRDRITLVRHYAFTHRKIFELTDLTPEDLPGIGNRKAVKCSNTKLFKGRSFMNNNCTEEKVDKEDKIGHSGADHQMSCRKCPKCGKYVKASPKNLRFHMLTHYQQVFFDVLPDKWPFKCPICVQTSRDRVTLARHYAFYHEKIFELTDLTPEDFYYSEKHIKDSSGFSVKGKSKESLQHLSC